MVYGNRYWNVTVTDVVAVERPGRTKRSITVHHRIPGVSKLEWMISLCLGCHAKVERTKMVLSEMNPLLLMLWRERHPKGHQQVMLDFALREKR